MLIASRDEEILHTLARKVRLFSFSQLAARWWSESPSGTANARKRLRQLLDAGYLELHRVTARPLPVIEEPLLGWRAGQPIPEFGAVAWRLQSRWTEPARPVTVYIATGRTANLFGGRNRGRLKHPHQASHDLGVSAVYLRLLETDPQAAHDWLGEDIAGGDQFGGKVPDAVLSSAGEGTRLAIEFGGAYNAERLRTFHHCCARRGLPYEVW
jgi:hypothetical protein